MKNYCVLLYILILTFSCSKDPIELDGFNTINKAELFTRLNPALTYNFIELRTSYDENLSFSPEFTKGIACENAENSELCSVTLENLKPDNEGIVLYCVQVCGTSYIVAQQEDINFLFDTIDEVIEFLGPIDTPDEALLLVQLYGYNFGFNDLKWGAYKEVDNGFEIIATRITASCAPIITTQYRILIKTDGILEVLEEAELERDENLCI